MGSPCAGIGLRSRRLIDRRHLEYRVEHAWRPSENVGLTRHHGRIGGAREIGDAENISKSYVSRILRLALLGPGIVEEILDGRVDHPLMLEQLERSLPATWVEQRVCISRAQRKCDRIQTSVLPQGG